MRRWVSLAAWVALLPGCNRSSDPSPPTAASSAPAQAVGGAEAGASVEPAAAPLPVDHTLPGELREGSVKVAGLPLPDGFVVDRVFDGETYAHGPASPEQTANYLRRRLDAASVEVGATKTIFTRARARGGAVSVRVEVIARGLSTSLIVIELHNQATEQGLSDEERWRKAGLRPDGSLIDPTKSF